MVGCMTHVAERLLHPLPLGEGWGEGKGTRLVRTHPHPRPLSQRARGVKARPASRDTCHAPHVGGDVQVRCQRGVLRMSVLRELKVTEKRHIISVSGGWIGQ